MSYQSKLPILLMMEEKKQKKIEEELHQLNHIKYQIEKDIQTEEEKIHTFYSELKKGGNNFSSFFSGAYDRYFVHRKQKELTDIQYLLTLKNKEYQEIKKKIEKIKDVETKRKKEYEAQVEKKEQHETEELKSMLRFMEGRSD